MNKRSLIHSPVFNFASHARSDDGLATTQVASSAQWILTI